MKKQPVKHKPKPKKPHRECSCLGHHCHTCGRVLDNRGAGSQYVARTRTHNLCWSCSE